MRILYAQADGYPYGAACSSRTSAFAALALSCGYEVDILADWSDQSLSDYKDIFWTGEYSGCNYYVPFRACDWNSCSVIGRHRKYKKLANSLNTLRKYDTIIVGANVRFPILRSIAKGSRIPLILESNEWYDSSTWTHGAVDIHYLSFKKMWAFDYPKADAVIAISSLLESHFSKAGKKTLLIPSIIDVSSTPAGKIIDIDMVHLMFAGSFGGTKDSLVNFLRAMRTLGSENRFVVDIYGPSLDQVKASLGDDYGLLDDLVGSVVLHGRVSREEVLKAYTKAHFGIFARPVRRSSQAGFSTKIAEGMSVGTPFIVNATGDIPLYLNDRNSILFQSDSMQDITAALRKVMKMSLDDYLALSARARATALSSFDISAYSNQFDSFICSVVEEGR